MSGCYGCTGHAWKYYELYPEHSNEFKLYERIIDSYLEGLKDGLSLGEKNT